MRKLLNAILSIFKKKTKVFAPEKPEPIKETPKELNFKEPTFVRVKGVKTPKRGGYLTPSGKFAGLVVHYTVSGRTKQNAINVLKYLVNHKDRLCCMVMDENGIIYIPEDFDIFRSRGAHAGTSRWRGYSGLNSTFAGIEICNWGLYNGDDTRTVSSKDGYVVSGRYQRFTSSQEDALINLVLWSNYHNDEYSIENTCGHDEARAQAGKLGDKQDPGGSLSLPMPKFRALLKKLALGDYS